ncbi:hypothetical protein V9K67_06930 [Paraflavisolibacter sp. H34]|uniref:hypothetical protein n=1 Tax=Huijunlia imazamoxiresistens TaxID=3127457 RepID=UPI003015AB14
MKETKIRLSGPEMDLMCDAGIILMKNGVLQKVKALLESLQDAMQAHTPAAGLLPAAAFSTPPKISKGENYLGLPYLVLDYPRRFTPGHICAVRTLFWWGHFFSSTLLLSGDYRDAFLPRAGWVYDRLREGPYYMGIHEDPWIHHFEPSNYTPVASLSRAAFGDACRALPHIKIAAKWPLSDWPLAANHLWENWKFLVQLMNEPILL